MTSSNRVGFFDGDVLAGLAPRNTLTTIRARWRKTSAKDGPWRKRSRFFCHSGH